MSMRYTEAVGKLFEVMEGRPDIIGVKFDRKNDSFDVISDTGIHICFGNEFRNKEYTKDVDESTARQIYDAVTNKLIDIGTDLEVNQEIQNVILDFIYK